MGMVTLVTKTCKKKTWFKIYMFVSQQKIKSLKSKMYKLCLAAVRQKARKHKVQKKMFKQAVIVWT